MSEPTEMRRVVLTLAPDTANANPDPLTWDWSCILSGLIKHVQVSGTWRTDMDHKPKSLPPTPEGPACPTCGDHHSMTLAEDKREYNKLAFEDGKWVRVGVAKSEPTGEDDSIRMFCTNCGEYFALPEGLCEL